MIGNRQHVDAAEFLGHRQRAHELCAVDEDDRPHSLCDRADRPDVGTVAGRGLHTAEGNQHGPSVDKPLDVVRLDPAVSERNLPNLVPFVYKQSPRVVVRAVLPLTNYNVLPSAPRAELCSDKAGSRRDRGDQGDIRRVGADESGDRCPALSPAASPRT